MRLLALILVGTVASCGAPAERKCETAECLGLPPGSCIPGDTEDCYDGADGTQDVGPCHAGARTCAADGTWTACLDQVVPTGEDGAKCHDGIDNNCNGTVDEDVDADGDGYTTCGGDCCDSTECTLPAAVNPGAFDAPGNNVDDDCNGTPDDTVLLCDQNIASNTQNAMDYARAIDICQTATMTDNKWGVIDAALTLADGTGTPDPEAHAIRPKFGGGVLPQGGLNMAMISSGGAAAKTDTNPAYHAWISYQHAGTQSCATTTETIPNTQCSSFPADFLAANNGKLPNAPGCPDADGTQAEDPVMLTFHIRVPTNAHSFKLSTNFFSAEFPEYACTKFNDFFVVLLDSTYAGTPANPTDKNLAFFQPMGTTMKVPVGVNLAHTNTGLFTQCVNGTTGCDSIGHESQITTCTSTSQLTGTGFDDPSDFACDQGSLLGGGTGWLLTSGNVVPGEIITLRIAIWDTSDHRFDSLAVIDGFQWSVDSSNPGTVIFDQKPHLAPVPADAVITRARR